MTKTNDTTPLTALLVKVAVILFPDGTVHHFRTKPESHIKNNQIHVEKMMAGWFKKNKVKYELRGIDPKQLTTAFAIIRMLESDFDKINKSEVAK